MKIALVDDEQNYLDEMAGLVCAPVVHAPDFLCGGNAVHAVHVNVHKNGIKTAACRVRDRLKIEQAARDYNFRKIRERQAHFAGRPVPESIRKGD